MKNIVKRKIGVFSTKIFSGVCLGIVQEHSEKCPGGMKCNTKLSTALNFWIHRVAIT
jgi:hypothetical protein